MPDSADDVTRGFVAWIGSVLPDTAIASRTLSDTTVGEGIDVRLLGLEPRPSQRVASPPAVVALDYLVSVRAADAFAEQRAAAELLFAALDLPDSHDPDGPVRLRPAADARPSRRSRLHPAADAIAAARRGACAAGALSRRRPGVGHRRRRGRGPGAGGRAARRGQGLGPGLPPDHAHRPRGRFRLPGMPAGGDAIELEIEAGA